MDNFGEGLNSGQINAAIFVSEEDAKISIFDHGLLYGDGVFEGIRIYHDAVFKLDEHLDRLYGGAKAIMLKIPMGVDELKAAVLETARRSGLSNGYMRLVVTRGVGDLGLNPISARSHPFSSSPPRSRSIRMRYMKKG